MKILVTGGAGYIGSTTADHLIKSGHEVLVVDNLSQGHKQAIPDGADFIESDIENTEVMSEILKNVDGIMHFAASIEAGESMEKPGKYFHNNTIKSGQLIEMAANAGVEYFVFSSTAAVYKSQDTPIVETDILEPANVYGESKKMTEDMLHWYSKVAGIKVGILRYFNAAGASMLDQPPIRGGGLKGATHIIPNILQVPLGMKEAFTIFGDDYGTHDGTCIRDYIHVDDLARAHLRALDLLNEGKINFDIFNLGNGRGFSNLEVLEVARKISGHEIPMTVGEKREGDAMILVANSDKAKNVLGWQPEHGELEVIVKSAWDWYRTHPNGFEDPK